MALRLNQTRVFNIHHRHRLYHRHKSNFKLVVIIVVIIIIITTSGSSSSSSSPSSHHRRSKIYHLNLIHIALLANTHLDCDENYPYPRSRDSFFNLLGPVVPKPINANPGLKINQGSYFSVSKR